MEFIPHSDYCLCKQLVSDKTEDSSSKVIFTKEDIPQYEILKLSYKMSQEKAYSVGDVIMTNSTPTKMKILDDFLYLIKEEYIIGKIQK